MVHRKGHDERYSGHDFLPFDAQCFTNSCCRTPLEIKAKKDIYIFKEFFKKYMEEKEMKWYITIGIIIIGSSVLFVFTNLNVSIYLLLFGLVLINIPHLLK